MKIRIEGFAVPEAREGRAIGAAGKRRPRRGRAQPGQAATIGTTLHSVGAACADRLPRLRGLLDRRRRSAPCRMRPGGRALLRPAAGGPAAGPTLRAPASARPAPIAARAGLYRRRRGVHAEKPWRAEVRFNSPGRFVATTTLKGASPCGPGEVEGESLRRREGRPPADSPAPAHHPAPGGRSASAQTAAVESRPASRAERRNAAIAILAGRQPVTPASGRAHAISPGVPARPKQMGQREQSSGRVVGGPAADARSVHAQQQARLRVGMLEAILMASSNSEGGRGRVVEPRRHEPRPPAIRRERRRQVAVGVDSDSYRLADGRNEEGTPSRRPRGSRRRRPAAWYRRNGRRRSAASRAASSSTRSWSAARIEKAAGLAESRAASQGGERVAVRVRQPRFASDIWWRPGRMQSRPHA